MAYLKVQTPFLVGDKDQPGIKLHGGEMGLTIIEKRQLYIKQ